MCNYPAFIISQSDKNSLYYWILKSSNGRTILRCISGFKTKQNAIKSMSNVLAYGILSEHYSLHGANVDNGGYFYRLYGRKMGKVVYGRRVNASLLAISGNGKFYQSEYVNSSYQSANKGIAACVSTLQTIANKRESGNTWYIDNVPDKRRK